MTNLWSLPKAPHTVIEIGGWQLVKLESYEIDGVKTHDPGDEPWELLPAKNEQVRQSMERAGFKQQCVMSHATVLAEAEQEGGYFVLSEPVYRPYGPKITYRGSPQETN